jgi:hypothetical protein
MLKLIIPPDNSSYNVTDGDSVVSVKLDGGASRYRSDKLGATSAVDVVWIVDKSGFEYLRAFYRGASISGALPFTIDLILDSADVTEHKSYFKQGTFKLVEQRGLSYTVSASLEVEPLPVDVYNLTGIVILYNESGDGWRFSEDFLNTIVNDTLPGVL